MKQKFLSLCFIIFSSICSQAYAQTVEVKSLTDFSTITPSASISLELLEPLTIENNKQLNSGTILTGKITNIKNPKRLKRDASFSFEAQSYKDNTGKHVLDKNITAEYSKAINKKQLAKSAALGVGGIFVKGLAMEVAAVQGAVKNETGNRATSGVMAAYEASPLSYIEKGSDIVIKINDIFYLKFPDVEIKKDINGGQNYTYTIEKE